MAQRCVLFAQHLAAGLRDGGLGDLVAGARIDVVGAHEEEVLALLARHPLHGRDHRLRGFLRGVEHALVLLLAFVVGGVEQQPFGLVEHRQQRLARGRGVAADDGRDLVALQQLAGLLGEHRVLARAVFDHGLDLLAHHAAGGVDLLDGQLLGIDQRGLGDGDGARERVQQAELHGGAVLRAGQAGHAGGGTQHDHRAAGLHDLAAVESVRHVKFLCFGFVRVIRNIRPSEPRFGCLLPPRGPCKRALCCQCVFFGQGCATGWRASV
ncbi:hypothetical protein D9M69_462980 [compost metagenome]